MLVLLSNETPLQIAMENIFAQFAHIHTNYLHPGINIRDIQLSKYLKSQDIYHTNNRFTK